IPNRNRADRIAVAMSVGRDGRVDGWAAAGGKLGYLVIGPRAWPMARGPDNHPFGSNGTGPDGSVRDGSGEDYRAMTPTVRVSLRLAATHRPVGRRVAPHRCQGTISTVSPS